MMRASFQTLGYHGYSVSFSPFYPNRIACASSQNFGLTGRGALYIIDHIPGDVVNPLQCNRVYHWPHDGLFDVTWSEGNPNIVWTASGDGCLEVWDCDGPQLEPVQVIKAHAKEIYNVEWGQVRSDGPLVLTASWDKSIKLWDGVRGQLLNTYLGHQAIVYASSWSPRIASTFASASADGSLRIWNLKQTPDRPALAVNASATEVITCDWCKYNDNLLVTGSADGVISGWDLRALDRPVFDLLGHSRAIKKVRFSPHLESIIASVSYDFTTRIWDFRRQGTEYGLNPLPEASSPSLLLTLQNHTEFVYGLDFNIHMKDKLVDCGWDQSVVLFSFPPSPDLAPL